MKLLKFLTLCGAVVMLSACVSKQQALYQKADDGDANSQLAVGLNLYHGENGFKQDKVKSLQYLEKSFKQGNKDAGFNIAHIYQSDDDYEKAVQYYQEAAQLGSIKSLDNLSVLYLVGSGVNKDLKQAQDYAQQAIKLGGIRAHRILGDIYLEQNKPKSALKQFNAMLDAPLTRSNSKTQKAYTSRAKMAAYLMLGDTENAYKWGSIALITTTFDDTSERTKQLFSRYQTAASQLSQNTKQRLAKTIIDTHYQLFESDHSFYKDHHIQPLAPGVIDPDRDQILNFVGYFTYPNRNLFGTINALKKRSEPEAKELLVISQLKLSNQHMKYGTMYLQTGAARTVTKEAISVMDEIENPSFDYFKSLAERKLDVMNNIYDYQVATIKAHKPAEGA